MKFLLLTLLIISVLFVVPQAYSSHQPCQPGYIPVVDSETGFTKCVFEHEIPKEIPDVPELQYADLQEHIQIFVNTLEGQTECELCYSVKVPKIY